MKKLVSFTLLPMSILCLFLSASCTNTDEYVCEEIVPQQINQIAETALKFAKSINNSNKSRSSSSDLTVKNVNQIPLVKSRTEDSTQIADYYVVGLNEDNGSVLMSVRNNFFKPLAYFLQENNIKVQDIMTDTISDLSFLIQNAIFNDGINLLSDGGEDEPDDEDYPDLGLLEDEGGGGHSTPIVIERMLPKCQVRWHQNNPYNVFCQTSSGERAAAGCVAVAGSQALTVLQPEIDFR